ncbi:MAG: hypothetical protein Q7U23_12310 [Methylococcales bacterium]|nr:hypothetical protein [Methylococcales bacterium]
MNRYKIIIGGLLVLSGVMNPCRAEQQAADWLPINDTDLSIQAGSALDFSALVETGVAGQHGRIIRGTDGHLAYMDSPNKPQRFFCASEPNGTGSDFPDHATADRYARQVRLHGYNVARFHFVENDLMELRTVDFDFNPEQLDRFYYFMAALKREGVYWLVDAMSSWNGVYGDVGDDRWIAKHNLKLGVYVDEEAKAHWQKLVQQVLNKENPYTKLTPLQDPALMGVILVNEGGLNHIVNLSPSDNTDLIPLNQAFTQWLVVKYGSIDTAMAAWGKSVPAKGIVNVPRRDWNASVRVADSQRFYYEMQKNTLQWMTAYVRGLGYQGLISAYDNWSNLQDSATRSALEWVDMHDYQEEPSDWVKAGSTLKQESSLLNKLAYIRNLASSRYWFKPFTISEYDQPFWDGSRYEAGLAMGAYGSLQNWDMLCRHSGAIELNYAKAGQINTRQAIHPFDIGMDPIGRAGETLTALLFARQDVNPALHKVDIRLTPEYVFDKQAGIGKLPDALTNVALVTGLGLSWQEAAGKVDTVIQPQDSAPSVIDKVIRKLRSWSGLVQDEHWEQLLGNLKATGILPKSNVSDSNGIFQSDTGQITLNTHNQQLSVVTANTEAVAFGAILPPPLANVTIKSASAPALFAASSLDGAVLAHSKHLLLIYATDARNSGMSFADAKSRELTNLGTLPVLIKNSRITFSLNNSNTAALHLYALTLNGQRGVELPIDKTTANTLYIELDLAKFSTTPTTYFELATN